MGAPWKALLYAHLVLSADAYCRKALTYCCGFISACAAGISKLLKITGARRPESMHAAASTVKTL